jgi:hypothetical protein
MKCGLSHVSMNPLLSSLVFRTGPAPLISWERRSCWTDLQGLCKRRGCHHYRNFDQGVFCGNFYSKRGAFASCRGVWCAECFVPLGKNNFPIKAQVDEDGEVLEDNGLVPRFRQARSGDHLMTPFQCELCHFRNIMGRNPVTVSRLDSELMEYFRRANFDAFWARETTTVMLIYEKLNEGPALSPGCRCLC